MKGTAYQARPAVFRWQEAVDQVRHQIALSETFVLLLVVGRGDEARRTFVSLLTRDLPEDLHLREFVFSPGELNPFQDRSYKKELRRYVIMASGLGALSAAEQRRALEMLNRNRSMLQRGPVGFILWIEPEHLTNLYRYAGDFADWWSAFIELPGELPETSGGNGEWQLEHLLEPPAPAESDAPDPGERSGVEDAVIAGERPLEPGWDVFLAHTAADTASAEALYDLLSPTHRIFLDTRCLQPGDEWDLQIARALAGSRMTVVLVSSAVEPAYFQREEIGAAIAQTRTSPGTRIVPVYLDGLQHGQSLPYGLRLRQGIDARAVGGLPGVAQLIRELIDRSRDAPTSSLPPAPDASKTRGATGRREGSATAAYARPDRMIPASAPASSAGVLDPSQVQPAERLSAAYDRLEELLSSGVAEEEDALRGVRQEILDLRRQLRAGGLLQTGDIVAARYTLLDRLGVGGFGSVWKAFDRRLRQLVAIKVLHGQHAHDQSQLERFFRGAREMARLSHPHIVRVLEPGIEDSGWHCFVMEYLPGGDLRRAVSQDGLEGRRVLEIVLQIGSALQYAHGRGILHRDVKPGNVLLDERGSARLTDFDLVMAADSTGGTRSGAGMGTFIYTAPETLRDASGVDSRADLFSLGMTAIFGLYGRDLPVEAFRDPQSLISQLNCPEAVRSVLTRAVDWDRMKRYETMDLFCEALRVAATEWALNAETRGMAAATTGGDRGAVQGVFEGLETGNGEQGERSTAAPRLGSRLKALLTPLWSTLKRGQ